MTRPLKVLQRPSGEEALAGRVRELEAEREALLELLAQQQRVAQAGLITSGLAHDVTNHVQVITGVTFLAQRSADPADWKHALEKVQQQCCVLTETTRAFLGFVKRRDTVGREVFPIEQAVEETSRLATPLARKHNVDLELGESAEATLVGERRLVIQALVNLVSNAIRASAGGSSRGRVGIDITRPEPRVCRIEVRDNGPGIPPELRRRLFRPFASGHEGKGGNGLGLFIVRQNIRRLDGSIRVLSSDEGTTFRVEFPC